MYINLMSRNPQVDQMLAPMVPHIYIYIYIHMYINLMPRNPQVDQMLTPMVPHISI